MATKKRTAADKKDNISVLQKGGVVAKNHQMSGDDVDVLNSLDPDEVQALINIKKKLGKKFLEKVSREGQFPHPLSASF